MHGFLTVANDIPLLFLTQTVGSLLRGNALRNAAAKSVSFGARSQVNEAVAAR